MRLLCWTVIVFVAPPGLLSQSPKVPPCSSDVLEADFLAIDGPNHTNTVAINLRNTSAETCFKDDYPGGTGVTPPDVQVRCEGDVMGNARCGDGAAARIMLGPGEWVHQTRSWKTVAADDATRCMSPVEMRWDGPISEYKSSFFISSRALLKPVCSPVVITNYAAGAYPPGAVPALAAASRTPVVRWANDEKIVRSHEHIPLRVTVEDPDHVLSSDEHGCPQLFVRVRDATPSRVIFSRMTRVDEVQSTCGVESADNAAGRFVMEFDLHHSVERTDDENRGEYAVNVSGLAHFGGRYRLVGTSSKLQLSMVNGKFIRRNWGAPVGGAAVSLNLDKDVYEVGSEIPLYIALTNFDAHAEIAAFDPYMDPPGVSVELQDSNGQPVSTGGGMMWMGHGFSHDFTPGLVFPVELKLSDMGFRPDRAGAYTVVAVWKPFRGGMDASAEQLTVRSTPVRFRLVPK